MSQSSVLIVLGFSCWSALDADHPLSIMVRGGLTEADVPLHAAAVEISLQRGSGTDIALSAWMHTAAAERLM